MRYIAGGASLSLDAEKCTGCGRCMEVCPHGVFERSNGKVEFAARERCMECGACAQNCSFEAVKVEAGVGCACAIINSMLYGGDPSCDCSGDSVTGGSSCC